jgi:uncharacterized membrane protein
MSQSVMELTARLLEGLARMAGALVYLVWLIVQMLVEVTCNLVAKVLAWLIE